MLSTGCSGSQCGLDSYSNNLLIFVAPISKRGPLRNSEGRMVLERGQHPRKVFRSG